MKRGRLALRSDLSEGCVLFLRYASGKVDIRSSQSMKKLEW